MNIDVVHQIPSGFNLSNELKQVFTENEYTSLRVLMAYVSWEGISLIHKELERFYDEDNNLEMIIGLSGGVSDPSTLRYLLQRLPKADICVFHTPTLRYIFHPKMYLFENIEQMLVYIGSNNFTLGGLFYNSECCVKLKVNKKENPELCSEVNSVWNIYRNPEKPFTQGNLKKINHRIISLYTKHTKVFSKRGKNRLKTQLDNFFPDITIPSLPVTQMKRKVIRTKKRRLKSGKTLLMEVLNETGADGTQVQIPRKVVEDYFNLDVSGHQTIELQFVRAQIRPAVLCHFGNNTHRISFPEISKSSRPLLLKFVKQGDSFYVVQLIRGYQYKEIIKKCSQQTRFGSKRWAIS